MTVRSARITILGTPDFKEFLTKEAKKEGISMSELVRQRCTMQPAGKDEEMLAALVGEVNLATARAKKTLVRGLKDAEQVIAELRSGR